MEKGTSVATLELNNEALEAVRQEWIGDLRERGVAVGDNANWLDIIGKKVDQDKVDHARAVGLFEDASLRDIAEAEAKMRQRERDAATTKLAASALSEVIGDRK